MIRINKQKTYLQQFEDQSKLQYKYTNNLKWIGWLWLCILSVTILIVPQFPVIMVGVIIGLVLMFTTAVDLQALYQTPMVFLIITLISTGVSILGFVFYVKLVERRPFYTIGLNQKNRLKKYLLGALIAIGMQMTYFVIIIVSGFGQVVTEPIISTNGLGINAIGIVCIALITFLIQGASEEVMIRGWLFPVLSNSYSAIIAIVISSGLFMILHLANEHISFIALINLFLYGVFAVVYALNEGGLWGVFAFHSIWNWFMGNVIGLPVSGMIPGSASLIETSLTGPIYITGGGFGPEGGIIVSLLLLGGIVFLTKKCFDKGILEIVDHTENGSSMDAHQSKTKTRELKPLVGELEQSLYVSEKSNGEIEMEFK